MALKLDKKVDLAIESERYPNPIASRQFIIALLEAAKTPLRRKDIAKQLELTDGEQLEALRRRLRAMERDGELIFTKKRCYIPTSRLAMVKGKVVGHPAGYGFLYLPQQPDPFFLEEAAFSECMDGDFILAQCTGELRQGKEIVRFVRILEPRSATIVGRFFVDKGLGYVIPNNPRFNFDVLIPHDQFQRARSGDMVTVQLIQRRKGRLNAVGNIIEVLGDPLAIGQEVAIAVREHQLPHEWSLSALKELPSEQTKIPQAAWGGRKDLTQIPFITIDGERAQDFDDAVFAERDLSEMGWKLYVAIADVSYYVQENSALDQEAYERGTSVYFPTSVLPMLPEALSNELCSLKPKLPRLALVCEMRISGTGLLTKYKFYEAVIQSRVRLTYTQVDKWITEKNPPSVEADIWASLQALSALYQQLTQRRAERGAISFDEPEMECAFDEQGKIIDIYPTARTEAHKIIEECMLLANRSAAQFMRTHHVPAPYRVHLPPKEQSFQALCAQLKALHVQLPVPQKLSTKFYNELLNCIRGRKDEILLRSLILRSMQPAFYSTQNQAHFGLAVANYTHFTSPIRRYPDLMVHRGIKAALKATSFDGTLPAVSKPETLAHLAIQTARCSFTERRAEEASQSALEHLKCHYLQQYVGKKFSGIISNVVPFGIFVRLDHSAIVGLVHISSLANEYYRCEPQAQRLISETTATVYQVGDRVMVRLKGIEMHTRRINLQLIYTVHQNTKKVSSFSNKKRQLRLTST